MTSLAKALVVCLVLAAACAAEDFIKHDFVVPKDGSVYSEPRIVHGHSVKDPNPYPWVVLLNFRCSAEGSPTYICTGSVIQDNVVLTAAHCYDYDCDDGVIGYVTVQRDYDNQEQQRFASKFLLHPFYDDTTNRNDIALWVLAEPFTVVHKYPTLPVQTTFDGLSVLAAGFGTTVSGGDVAFTLQQVGMEVQEDFVCEFYYGSYDSDSEICVGADGGGRDTCQGDSGGPVFTTSDCCYYPAASVRGITSYGAVCGTAAGAVYADVSFYRTWIITTLLTEGIIYENPTNQCCDVCNGDGGDDNGVDGGTDCTLSPASTLSAWCALIAVLVAFSLMY